MRYSSWLSLLDDSYGLARLRLCLYFEGLVLFKGLHRLLFYLRESIPVVCIELELFLQLQGSYWEKLFQCLLVRHDFVEISLTRVQPLVHDVIFA